MATDQNGPGKLFRFVTVHGMQPVSLIISDLAQNRPSPCTVPSPEPHLLPFCPGGMVLSCSWTRGVKEF